MSIIKNPRKLRKNNFYLLLILLGLSILPVLVIGALSINYFNNYIGNQLNETYNARLLQLETDFELHLEDINEALNTLVLASANFELDGIKKDNISDFESIELIYTTWDLFSTIKQTSKFINSIYFLNSQKEFILTSEKEASSFETYSDRLWADNMVVDVGVMELSPRSVSGFNVLTRIISTSGFLTEVDGYFVINIDIGTLNEWIKTISLSQQIEFFVYNDEGTYIAGTYLKQTPLSESGYIYFRQKSEAGWEYVLRVPSSLYNSFIYRTIFIVILMTGVLIFLGLFFSVYVSNRLYTPIENIIEIIEDGAGTVPDNGSEISFIGDMFLKITQEQMGLKGVLEQNSLAIKESLLKKLILGDHVEHSEIINRLNRDKDPLNSCLYCSAVVLLLPKGSNISVLDTGPAQAIAVGAYESTKVKDVRILGAPLDLERITLLICGNSIGQIEESLLKTRKFLESSLSMEPLVVVGGLYDSIEDVKDSFSEAMNLLDKTIPDKSEEIIFHKEVLTHEQGRRNYPWAIETGLVQVLKQGDRSRVPKLISEFIEEISIDGISEREYVEMSILSLISGIVRALGSDNIDVSSNCYRDFLIHDRSLKEAENWLNSFVINLLNTEAKKDPKETKYRMMIQEYISENYHKDISLEHIADWMGISYSYLRKIFSTLFGFTFLEYIHSIRIEKARDLLRDSNMGISEVSKAVGYLNTSRLNRNFNKIIGCNPSEYRIRVRKSLIE
ncbi:MAG: AraC family transcriptional regulator [Spirochaetaceae bacterium]